jgi:hypothetical protein
LHEEIFTVAGGGSNLIMAEEGCRIVFMASL